MYKYYLETVDVNDKEVLITGIHKENNEYVSKGETVCSVETTKVSYDIESEESGYIEFLFNEYDRVKFGELLFCIKEKADEKMELVETTEVSKEESKVQKEKKDSQPNETIAELVLTEKAQKYLEENHIPINDIKEKLAGKSVIKEADIKELMSRENQNRGTMVPIIYNRKRILIIGAGSGGEAVADILLDYPEYEVIGFVDTYPRPDYSFYGIKVVCENVKEFPFIFDRSLYDAVVISMAGNLQFRKEIFDLYTREGISFINAIDKSAKICRNTSLGVGNVIGANSYIGVSCSIGENNWIGACVCIGHHNDIGSHNLFGPNFASPGIIKIGNLNKFGACSTLNNFVEIGNGNTVTNNVSVYRNVKDDEVIKK